MTMKFPYFACGKVVHGFGRGSKQLGIPTANFPVEVVDKLPVEYAEGVYYGWAQVDHGDIYKMVMSIGRNPYFNNEKRTMETHILHEFKTDFYDSTLRILVMGYLRPMSNYKSLDALIEAIHDDIRNAQEKLDLDENKFTMYQKENLFVASKL